MLLERIASHEDPSLDAEVTQQQTSAIAWRHFNIPSPEPLWVKCLQGNHQVSCTKHLCHLCKAIWLREARHTPTRMTNRRASTRLKKLPKPLLAVFAHGLQSVGWQGPLLQAPFSREAPEQGRPPPSARSRSEVSQRTASTWPGSDLLSMRLILPAEGITCP